MAHAPRLRWTHPAGALLWGALVVGAHLACGGGEDAGNAYVETGDIERLRARGTLRVGRVGRARLEEAPALEWGAPSSGAVARAFSARLGLELEVVDFPDEAAATEGLLEGRVDGIAGRHGPGIGIHSEEVALSRPFRIEPGVFLARTGAAPGSLEELEGRTVSFGTLDDMAGFAPELVAAAPGIAIDTLEELASVEDALGMLVRGDIDVTLVERWVGEALVEVEPGLELGAEFGEVTYTAAVRRSNPDLLRALNDFAFVSLPVGLDAPPLFGDLPEIRERRVLRVLTLNGPSSYYVHKGELVGFDLELIRAFAEEQGLIPQMIVVPSTDQLIPWLRDGVGDVIGVGIYPRALTDTAGVAFTRSYQDVQALLVARTGSGVEGLEDVAGHVGVVGWNNPFLPVVESRQDSLGFELRIARDAESTGQLLDRLERGEADMTILESHLAEPELADRDSVRVVHTWDDGTGRQWATRGDQPELLAALNAYLDREVGGLTHAVLIRKYFNPETRRVPPPEPRPDGSLSPWDDLVREHAEPRGLDWRLLTAQMFVESRFDPEARSAAGAYGLMQMMPATARELGVEDIEDPEAQIEAGVRYLRWLYDRLPSSLTLDDRMAFTFAAYNAGFGHLTDARRVAERQGLDPDRWSGNVEQAMLSLSDPDVYRTVPHGYVRGHEPVRYVRRINELGLMYFRVAPEG
ncbi:MAG TPA: transporter substrate-binding domain-containing protein [Longimicrobiales bacterium]|nr:transporter substrate-binding domain-containing protein [Longimicrobiales bacterium]